MFLYLHPDAWVAFADWEATSGGGAATAAQVRSRTPMHRMQMVGCNAGTGLYYLVLCHNPEPPR